MGRYKVNSYNAYIRKTRYDDTFDVSVPEIFAEQVFEILGAHNVLAALHEACEIALQTDQFHLQIFCNPEDSEEILNF